MQSVSPKWKFMLQFGYVLWLNSGTYNLFKGLPQQWRLWQDCVKKPHILFKTFCARQFEHLPTQQIYSLNYRCGECFWSNRENEDTSYFNLVCLISQKKMFFFHNPWSHEKCVVRNQYAKVQQNLLSKKCHIWTWKV